MDFFKLIALEERIVFDGAAAAVIYVDIHATGANTGSSWTNAYTDLQSALSQAASTTAPEQIWVADGTYRPTSGTDRSISFNLPNNVALYGGFDGGRNGEKFVFQANPSKNVTILSGNIGDQLSALDNSYTVVTANNVTASITGFTITAGQNQSLTPTNDPINHLDFQHMGGNGAGLDTYDSNILVENCIFVDNHVLPKAGSTSIGGGLAAGGSDAIGTTLVVLNSTFENNSARNAGGLGTNGNVHSTITGCTFENNQALVINGGAIYFYDIRNGDFSGVPGGLIGPSTAVVKDSTFKNNSTLGSGGVGGAVAWEYVTSVTIDHCDFSGNSTRVRGGAIYVHTVGDSIIKNSLFENNTATNMGGAIEMNFDNPSIEITNNVFINNHSGAQGGGAVAIGNEFSHHFLQTATVSDNQFFDNSTTGTGGALIIRVGKTNANVEKNLFMGNSASGVGGGAISLNMNPLNVVNPDVPALLSANLIGNICVKNTAPQGASVYDNGTQSLSLNKNVFAQNTASVDDSELWLKGTQTNINGLPVATTSTSDILAELNDSNQSLQEDEIILL